MLAMWPGTRITRKRNLLLSLFGLCALVLIATGCGTSLSGTPGKPGPSGSQVGTPAPQLFGGDVPPTPTAAMLVPEPPQNAATAEKGMEEQATAQAYQPDFPVPVQTNEATVAPSEVRVSDVWGDVGGPSGIKQVPIDLADGYMFLFYSADPEGKFVVGAIVPRALDKVEPRKLVLADVDSGHTREIARYSGPVGGDMAFEPALFGADTDGEWVVWNEKSSIHAYNIVTGVTRTVAEAAPTKVGDAGKPLYPPAFHAPRADHGTAVWEEAEPNQGAASYIVPTRILRANLEGGEPTELSSYGTAPTISWPYAGWIEYPKSGKAVNKYTLRRMGVITLLNLETGDRRALTNLKAPASFALSGDALVYSPVFGQAFITDLAGTSMRLISPDVSSAYGNISMNSRVVTWVYYPPATYDRSQDKLVRLSLGAAQMAGMQVVKRHTLAWQAVGSFIEMEGIKPDAVLPNDQPVYVVDTDRLPK